MGPSGALPRTPAEGGGRQKSGLAVVPIIRCARSRCPMNSPLFAAGVDGVLVKGQHPRQAHVQAVALPNHLNARLAERLTISGPIQYLTRCLGYSFSIEKIRQQTVPTVLDHLAD